MRAWKHRDKDGSVALHELNKALVQEVELVAPLAHTIEGIAVEKEVHLDILGNFSDELLVATLEVVHTSDRL